MNTAEVILDYLKVLVWPAVVVTLAYVFRAQLRHVLDRITRVETPAGSVELTMTAGVTYEQAARVAAELPEPPPLVPQQPQPPEPDEDASAPPPSGPSDVPDAQGPVGTDAGQAPEQRPPYRSALLITARRRMHDALAAQERGNARSATEASWRAVQLAVRAAGSTIEELSIPLARRALADAGHSPQIVDLYVRLASLYEQLKRAAQLTDDYAVAMFVTSCEIFLTAIGVPPVRRSAVAGVEWE